MKVLLLNQCFHPDHVSTAQHLTDLALALRAEGHEVTVVAASRGYDDPGHRFPVRETWQGIEIHRIWTPGLGKKAKWRRFTDFAVFWLNATLILLRLPRFDVTVCLTSPPLISTLGTAVAVIKGGAVVPWVMDLNPDEAVAAGWLRAGGLAERVLTTLQKWSFRRAARIIALDRFMAARIEAKGVSPALIHTDPPWSHDDQVRFEPDGREAFRTEHGLVGKFVVMYSGNHSPCHPLDTLLEAALRLRGDDGIRFLFVGGGSEMSKVKAFRETHALTSIITLPYQPLQKLAASLSSADLHVVVLGDSFAGIVHPCKIYNILTLGLPFLAIGPEHSHLNDLASRLHKPGFAFQAQHGEVEGVLDCVAKARAAGFRECSEESQKVAAEFSRETLCGRMVRILEQAAGAV